MSRIARQTTGLSLSIALPFLLLALLFLLMPTRTEAADVVVHTCTTMGLQAAIAEAGDGDIVTFHCTVGGPTIVLTQTQILSRDVTLDGGNAITLSGGGTVRLFTVPIAQKGNFVNLTLTDGRGNPGNAINVVGTADITNVTFVRNAGLGNGGALAVAAAGTASISFSRFLTNTDSADGGAIYTAGSLSVDHSDFFDNRALAGGAIAQEAGVASVFASTFEGDSGELGGAIFAKGKLTLAGDEFDHNSSLLTLPSIGYVGGGALNVTSSGLVAIQDSVFFSNTAQDAGLGSGGAILNQGLLFMLDNLFSQNDAPNAGGAIFNTQILSLTQNTFVRNTSLRYGGAISNTGVLIVSASTFVTNSSGTTGGAIASNASVGVETSQFMNNTATDAGGALRNQPGGFMVVEFSTLYSNTAVTGAGGAAFNNANLSIGDSTLEANKSGASGGAVASTGPNTPTLFLLNDTVVNNTASSGGAAVRRLGSGVLDVRDSIVAFNLPANCQGVTSHINSLQFGDMSCGAGITMTDPLLGPLQDNGGPAAGVFDVGLLTRQPLVGSPVVDAGDAASCLPIDERGFARFNTCDIGAVERVFPLSLPLVRK